MQDRNRARTERPIENQSWHLRNACLYLCVSAPRRLCGNSVSNSTTPRFPCKITHFAHGQNFQQYSDADYSLRALSTRASFAPWLLPSALAVVVSLPFAPWRVTTGLLLGGLLSLLSHHWMRTSIAAAFAGALAAGAKPQLTSVKYILRYFVVAAAVFAAYKLNLVSLPATIAGLCSFVVALFVEA